jgi:hypothetical protein
MNSSVTRRPISRSAYSYIGGPRSVKLSRSSGTGGTPVSGLSYWTFAESFCTHVILGKLRHAGAIVGACKEYDFETPVGLEVERHSGLVSTC